jgi:hypothetical protein
MANGLLSAAAAAAAAHVAADDDDDCARATAAQMWRPNRLLYGDEAQLLEELSKHRWGGTCRTPDGAK